MRVQGSKELLDAGLRAHKSGRLQEAAQLYDQVLTFDADNAGALTSLGMLLAEMKQFERAESLLRRALGRTPDRADAYANLAGVLHDAHKFAAAIDCCERGLKLAPEHKRLLNTLASSLSGAERYDEALALLERIAAANPGYAKASYFTGMLHAKRGNCDAAVQAFDRATRIDPRDLEAFVSWGECLMAHGRAADALGPLDRALDIEVYEVRALALKTLALAELDRRDEEAWLSDPHHFVHTFRLADLGYRAEDIAALNRALADFAANEPSMREDPPEYATYKGWHTTRNLAEYRDDAPSILKQFIGYGFEQRLKSLPNEDPRHPFVRGAPPRFHLDLWAVKMTSGGKMLPHIHAEGWLSGVYYVEVPAVVRDPAAGQAGWLKVGGSRRDIPLTREPITRAVQPEPGLLVTFPSYLWHDTIPLPVENTERRLCLAFDLHPRKAG
jgi:tetratricopeptide (TPR) repeat protein